MTSPQPQTALDEIVVDDEELAKALDDRELAKGKAREARKKKEMLDTVVNEKVAALDLKVDEPVRCGRFRITKVKTAPREVVFTTPAGHRVKITPDKPEE